jgi:transcriptional regulator with XRE-family HTH domain
LERCEIYNAKTELISLSDNGSGMRRTSLSPKQAQLLADLLRNRREALGLAMREVAARSGCNIATMSALEAGTNRSPQPDTLKAVASVLALPIYDVFVLVDWLPPDELPTLRPYLRSKYRNLTDRQIDSIERYTARLARYHGSSGPANLEDERLDDNHLKPRKEAPHAPNQQT